MRIFFDLRGTVTCVCVPEPSTPEPEVIHESPPVADQPAPAVDSAPEPESRQRPEAAVHPERDGAGRPECNGARRAEVDETRNRNSEEPQPSAGPSSRSPRYRPTDSSGSDRDQNNKRKFHSFPRCSEPWQPSRKKPDSQGQRSSGAGPSARPQSLADRRGVPVASLRTPPRAAPTERPPQPQPPVRPPAPQPSQRQWRPSSSRHGKPADYPTNRLFTELDTRKFAFPLHISGPFRGHVIVDRLLSANAEEISRRLAGCHVWANPRYILADAVSLSKHILDSDEAHIVIAVGSNDLLQASLARHALPDCECNALVATDVNRTYSKFLEKLGHLRRIGQGKLITVASVPPRHCLTKGEKTLLRLANDAIFKFNSDNHHHCGKQVRLCTAITKRVRPASLAENPVAGLQVQQGRLVDGVLPAAGTANMWSNMIAWHLINLQ